MSYIKNKGFNNYVDALTVFDSGLSIDVILWADIEFPLVVSRSTLTHRWQKHVQQHASINILKYVYLFPEIVVKKICLPIYVSPPPLFFTIYTLNTRPFVTF